MTESSGNRSGWKEPATLSAEEADDLRTLLDGLPVPKDSGRYPAYQRLLARFLPSLEVCVSIRSSISDARALLDDELAEMIDEVTDPDELEPVYAASADAASEIFESRPPECEMQCPAAGEFFCDRCKFVASFNPITED